MTKTTTSPTGDYTPDYEALRIEYQAKRREETKSAKSALKAAGFAVKSVKHGRGTAAGWLDIALAEPYSRERDQEAVKVVQLATGRRSPEEYDGNIIVSMGHAATN